MGIGDAEPARSAVRRRGYRDRLTCSRVGAAGTVYSRRDRRACNGVRGSANATARPRRSTANRCRIYDDQLHHNRAKPSRSSRATRFGLDVHWANGGISGIGTRHRRVILADTSRRHHIYFSIPWIKRHLRPDPVRNCQFLVFIS